MTVVVAGSSGLIGTALVEALRADGHDVVRLVRREARADDEVTWNPSLGGSGATPALRATVSGAHAVVNLAGAGVGEHRWDDRYRAQILDSRVASTTCLATAIAECEQPPRVFVSGSAGGYYGDTGPSAVDETAPRGATFLATVAAAWEKAAGPARERGVRVVHPRTAVVADPDGGAFGRWLPILRAGIGGRLGSGRQWWSLISLRDEVAALRHLMDDERLDGPVNLAAPEQVTVADLTSRLGSALHRPTLAFVPGVALRAVLGEFAEELLIDQRLEPRRLLDTGFEFADPTVDDIVRDLLAG
ncbi:MAG: TIGR01777 family protein [Frankiales bacterium]|nr:TIGR01777 family protein [Frankiales bacterium]